MQRYHSAASEGIEMKWMKILRNKKRKTGTKWKVNIEDRQRIYYMHNSLQYSGREGKSCKGIS